MFRKKRNMERGDNCDGSLEPLILYNSKIKFSEQQLCNLNFILCKKLENNERRAGTRLVQAKNIAERLTQRLLCEAGMKDPRFASKFLVDSNPESINNTSTKTLSYLVRLDELSTPPLYELDTVTKLELIENDSDCPPSYCRIRLPSPKMKSWNEFINPNGFLRRDKVQTRLVKLLAEAAAAENVLPFSRSRVDESVSCGLPGKIVDAATLYHIMKVPSFEQLYYGQDGRAVQFPDPSEFRIAIVDEPQGIMLRLEFLSTSYANICLDVRLLVAIGIDAWPSTSDFPRRIPLIHPDCLLYNTAAESGMFLVGFGVQSSAWQMRVPASEYIILNNYGNTSTIRTILNILNMSEEEIDLPRSRKKYQLSYKILNKYMFLTTLFEELEKNSTKPLNDAINWSSMYLSKIILTILDKLAYNLAHQKLPNYFFKQSNLLVNPGHLSEDDYIIEANNVKMFILRLYDESLQNFSGDEEFKTIMRKQESEINLLVKWKELITGMLPQLRVKSDGFCLMESQRKKSIEVQKYTKYQLEYIILVLRSVLDVRKKILKIEESCHNLKVDEDTARVEDVVYLTSILMVQAKDIFLSKYSKLDKKQSKLGSEYTRYTAKFIEQIRGDTSIGCSHLDNDLVMVETIINLLHKAIEFNPKILGRFIQPYLRDLFEVTFAISWHLEDVKNRMNTDELKSLGCFCKLLNSGEITPVEGLVDGVEKKWAWAKEMMELTQDVTIRIVLIPDRDQVNQYVMCPNENSKGRVSGEANYKKKPERKNTFLGKSCFNTSERCTGLNTLDAHSFSQHELLKMKSPMTSIISKLHRRGEHRGCGNTLTSLIYMKKMGVFQEITSTLSNEDKLSLVEIMNELQDSRSSKNLEKNWTNTLPRVQKNISFTSKEAVQKYIPKEESAGVSEMDDIHKDKPGCHTLLRNCRALRLTEDHGNVSSCSNLMVKGELRKSESFKY